MANSFFLQAHQFTPVHKHIYLDKEKKRTKKKLKIYKIQVDGLPLKLSQLGNLQQYKILVGSTRVRAHTYTNIYIYTYTHIYKHILIYINICACIYSYINTHTYIIYIYIPTFTGIYIYT